ncbi:MAG: helix-turn-helix transcriptional regulator [Acidimicrobiales bacterium]|nr:helix-turn-helix transcriptional regulator [Acidimicrobiales bacterium]
MQAAGIIRSARERAGLTLRALGEAAGTSHSTIAAYEAGRTVPTVATLDRIVRAAGFALDASLARRVDPGRPLPRGDELAAVLDLAEAFPARHHPTLDYPPFGR